jgi:glycosyltransferase involved in cell wall biosynthesis
VGALALPLPASGVTAPTREKQANEDIRKPAQKVRITDLMSRCNPGESFLLKMTNKTQPLVSVIIPVFNGASYLKEAVSSVLKSTYKNIEILLIDDGSSDHSKKLCSDLEKKYKKVHFYGFKANKGQGVALNYGIKHALGKYICRLNQDDLMLPNRISTQVKYLISHPNVVALGTSITLFEPNGKTQIVHFLQNHTEIKKMWHVVSPFADPSVMFSKSVALKVGGHDQEFWPANDTQLWIKMGQIGELANIDKPLVRVLYHPKAASVKHFKKLTSVTWKLHRWIDREISPAPWYVKLFWLGEYVSGMLFSPNFNWAIYRLLKKGIYFSAAFFNFLHHITLPPIVAKVIPQPIQLKTSGQ